MNKRQNILISILVIALIVGVVIAVSFTSTPPELAQDVVPPAPSLPENTTAGRDTQRTDVNKLIADLHAMTEKVEGLNQAMTVLKSENKAQAQALELIKDGAQKHVIDQVTQVSTQDALPSISTLGPRTDASTQVASDKGEAGLLGILPPIGLTPQSQMQRRAAQQVDPNQIVWIEPLDASFDAQKSKPFASIATSHSKQGLGLIDEVSARAKGGMGLESGKDPRYTIAHGSVIASARTTTALVGKVPIRGSVQDPWEFKIQTGPTILMANRHQLSGLEGTIVEGTAIGNLPLKCVTGRVETITFIFNDGRIVTHRAQDQKKGLGYISDSAANPCIPGRLITNAPQVIGQLGILGAIQGGATAYANQETQTTRNLDGSTGTVVIGDHFKNQIGNAAAAGAADINKWFADRMDQYFDVIYVPAGLSLDVHIAEEIKLDYDPIGRKVQYEGAHATHHGYMD